MATLSMLVSMEDLGGFGRSSMDKKRGERKMVWTQGGMVCCKTSTSRLLAVDRYDKFGDPYCVFYHFSLAQSL